MWSRIPLYFYLGLSLLISPVMYLFKSRRVKLFYASIAALGILITLFSCNKACQVGYENPNCSIEIRNQYENLNYTVTESKNGDSAYTYAATIVSSPQGILRVQLTNIANNFLVNNVTASVTATDTLTIAYQAPDSNGHYIQGIGVLTGNTLALNYAITYPDSLPVLHTQVDYYQSVWVHP